MAVYRTPPSKRPDDPVTFDEWNSYVRGNGEALDGRIAALGVWQAYTPTWDQVTTSPTLGNGTLDGRYVQVGNTVTAQAQLVLGSTSTVGTGLHIISLPVAARTGTGASPWGTAFIEDQSAGAQYIALVGRHTGGTDMNFRVVRLTAASNNDVELAHETHPFTWASGDRILAQLTYEAA